MSDATYSQAEFDEAYEIGKRDGYSDAVQHIDQQTGGDGEYRYCLGMEDDIRHKPDAATMIQRIVDRFEVLNLLDEATKTGNDQPDDVPAPQPNTTGSDAPLVNALVLQNALEMTGCDDEAELIDMANVGKSLMERIDSLVGMPGPYHRWSPADDPAEIVFDLVNDLDELREENTKLKASLEKISSSTQTTDLLWWQIEARAALATTEGLAP